MYLRQPHSKIETSFKCSSRSGQNSVTLLLDRVQAWKGLVKLRGGGGNLHMSWYGDVPLFWILFWGCSWIFGYLFGLFPDFWVTFFGYSRIFGYHFLVKFDFFQNNPDFGVFGFWYFHQWHCGMLPAGLLFLWFYSSRFCSIMLVQRVPYCL